MWFVPRGTQESEHSTASRTYVSYVSHPVDSLGILLGILLILSQSLSYFFLFPTWSTQLFFVAFLAACCVANCTAFTLVTFFPPQWWLLFGRGHCFRWVCCGYDFLFQWLLFRRGHRVWLLCDRYTFFFLSISCFLGGGISFLLWGSVVEATSDFFLFCLTAPSCCWDMDCPLFGEEGRVI